MSFKLRTLLLPLFIMAFSVFTNQDASGQTSPQSSSILTSDKDDYASRSNAVFTGSGFAPGETVTLRVKNLNRPCNTTPSSTTLKAAIVSFN